jgi:hypothetical protein
MRRLREAAATNRVGLHVDRRKSRVAIHTLARGRRNGDRRVALSGMLDPISEERPHAPNGAGLTYQRGNAEPRGGKSARLDSSRTRKEAVTSFSEGVSVEVASGGREGMKTSAA